MPQDQTRIKFSKFLGYILGHKPDEFGLMPDSEGYIKIKELLKAINEESGWGHIRRSDIAEVMITLSNLPFEIKDNMIRAINRNFNCEPLPAANLPKLLYVSIRQRAYPAVIQNGIFPSAYNKIVLSSDIEFSKRLGKRFDQKPITLTVSVEKSLINKANFYQMGSLYLSDFIPPDCFTGPPLTVDKPDYKKKNIDEESSRPRQMPGSFILDFDEEKKSKFGFERKGRQKEISWKKERKRKEKIKNWGS